MRLTIATKLFVGFLCVIGLNAAYLFIVYKIDDVNSIVDILKHKNEVQNRLLRLKTLHSVQGTSVISFIKIGRRESVDNFRAINGSVTSLIDTVRQYLDTIINIDSILPDRKLYGRNQNAIGKEMELIKSIAASSAAYSAFFEELAALHDSLKRDARKKEISRSLDSLDIVITREIDSSETVTSEHANRRIRDISRNIAEAKEMMLVILGSVTLFSLLFGLIFSRTITNALRRLKESAARIGKADFDLIPSGFPNDEIGDLARAFFNMSVDLRSKQEELIKSKRLAAIGEVVASVNHEINNPLMIISGNAQFLEMSMEGYPADMRERVQTIIEETGRISEITRKLREIRNPVSQDYLSGGGQMIDIKKSTKGKE